MKLGIFTDSHYSSQELTCGNRYNSRSLEKIKEAYRFFEKENCDLVACLGDLTDWEDSHEKEIGNLKQVAEVMNSSSVPTICLMGNHDAFTLTESEFYEILGGHRPETLNVEDKTLIFLDACYFKSGVHYMPGDTDWTDAFYPHTAELKNQLDKANGEVYLFLHQNLDPEIREDHRIYNSAEVNEILQESGKVKVVYQGHYHWGKESVHNGIRYVAFPAMCERDSAYFIEEI